MTKRTPITASQLGKDIEETLKKWRKDDLANSPLRNLYLARSMCRQQELTPYQAVKKILTEAIEIVGIEYPGEMELVSRRYLKGESALVIGHKESMGQSTVFNQINDARQLIERRIAQLEESVKARYLAEFNRRLEPPTYSTLIGIDKAIRELSKVVLSSEPPWIVSIEGIGGIGKTALADALARHLIDRGQIYDLAWVTARQAIFSPGMEGGHNAKPALTSEALLDAIYGQLIGPRPSTFTQKDVIAALTRLFKAHAYLVFIDNLETVIDVEALLPSLRGLAGPTHFVLTSRHSLYGQSDIFLYSQGELSKKDALLLFRHEARTHNLPAVNQATDQELRRVLSRTGGNPLAIKLVVGLLHLHSLEEIANDLIGTRNYEVNQLYDHIFMRSWERLSEVEQNTFLAMSLVDELGGTIADLVGVSRIDTDVLRSAIPKLLRLNLVNRLGDLHESRYAIHALTRSFIHRKLIEWE